MFWQWSVLAIQPRTTWRGVWKPLAMFSPAEDQWKPAALIRAAKFAPWVNRPMETIVVGPALGRAVEVASLRAGAGR